MKIKITVNSHMHELTVEEARRVYNVLDSIFGTLGGKESPTPGYAPMYPGAKDPISPPVTCKAH